MKEETYWKIAHSERKMSRKLALKIERVRKNNSWRGTAYEITNGQTSNQILGMYLCRVASIGERIKIGDFLC